MTLNRAKATTKTHRVFFALWPDDALRKKLGRAFDDSTFANAKGRRFRDSNLHLTLHFLGNINPEYLVCVQRQADKIKTRPFSLRIDHFGQFKRAGVLWLGPHSVPDELNRLHSQLGKALSVCDFESEDRAFQPHITVMRKFHSPIDSTEIEPVDWYVNRYALVESITKPEGVEYQVLKFY